MIVRPIVPSDEAAYRSILERTTAEDRYCRFFHMVDHFDPAEVHRFVEDRADTTGVIAFDGSEPLGAAHGVSIDETSVELAIVVAHDTRRRGVGRALATALIDILTARGFQRLVAISLRENHSFERLARSVGLRVDRADGDTLHWFLQLNETAAPLATSGDESQPS